MPDIELAPQQSVQVGGLSLMGVVKGVGDPGAGPRVLSACGRALAIEEVTARKARRFQNP